MARQVITTTIKKYRKSKTYTDKKGRKHCKTCGAYLSGRGKRK